MAKPLSRPEKQNIETHVEKHLIKNLPAYFSAQFKQHVSTAIIAAFSFLIALTWKDLIVHSTATIIGKVTLEKYPYLQDVSAAIVVTIIALIGIALITRWARRPEIITSATTVKKVQIN